MPYKHEFLFPEYYSDFACKCGDCRSTCCHGWGIALSQDDYFRIIGADYSPELRRRLDIAFRPATNPSPTPERYAMISYNWLGRCPIQTDDGYCALHRECGEGAIPEICRRYPRCIRTVPIHECCTSTSCEYTLELLYRDDEPVRFVSTEMEMFDEIFDAPAAAQMDIEEYKSIREKTFEILSDRSYNIDERINNLASEFGVTLPHRVMPHGDAALLFEKLLKSSNALAEIADDILAYYADDFETPRFTLESIEKMDIYLEKMLVNHVFYKAFPRSFANSTMLQEISSLTTVRALHRYVTEAYIGVHGWSIDNFVDVTAQLFRMIEHSRFDEVASNFIGV
ncbi:MAG: flagellin lysine-N-methylase [Clostridia bacterium]|nr:flagellin lysine-N-methylase [Clostridia bacterium]